MRIEVYDMVNMKTNTSVPVEEMKIILNKFLRLKNQQLLGEVPTQKLIYR